MRLIRIDLTFERHTLLLNARTYDRTYAADMAGAVTHARGLAPVAFCRDQGLAVVRAVTCGDCEAFPD